MNDVLLVPIFYMSSTATHSVVLIKKQNENRCSTDGEMWTFRTYGEQFRSTKKNKVEKQYWLLPVFLFSFSFCFANEQHFQDFGFDN